MSQKHTSSVISNDLITELQLIMKEEYGLDLPYEEVVKFANDMLQLAIALVA